MRLYVLYASFSPYSEGECLLLSRNWMETLYVVVSLSGPNSLSLSVGLLFCTNSASRPHPIFRRGGYVCSLTDNQLSDSRRNVAFICALYVLNTDPASSRCISRRNFTDSQGPNTKNSFLILEKVRATGSNLGKKRRRTRQLLSKRYVLSVPH